MSVILKLRLKGLKVLSENQGYELATMRPLDSISGRAYLKPHETPLSQ